MSKSSSTNYPRGFLTKSLSHLLIVSSLTECDGSAARIAASHGFRYTKRQVLLGGYSSEVPPLPIPNREVKLTHADGTAFCGGRVGSRLFKPNPIRVRLFFVCMCVYCSPSVGKECSPQDCAGRSLGARRPATHSSFVCALRRLRPENIVLIHTRQPIPRQKRFRTEGGRGDGA